MNCVVTPLTAVLRTPNIELASIKLKTIIAKILNECRRVAAAEGVHLGPGLVDVMLDAVSRYSSYPPMYQNLSKNRKTEIDLLNGRIVELDRVHGIPTPVNQALTALIKHLERKK